MVEQHWADFVYLFIYIYLFIHSFIYLFTYLTPTTAQKK